MLPGLGSSRKCVVVHGMAEAQSLLPQLRLSVHIRAALQDAPGMCLFSCGHHLFVYGYLVFSVEKKQVFVVALSLSNKLNQVLHRENTQEG